MGRRHQVVSVGADGQAPDLPMVTLRGRVSRVSLTGTGSFLLEGGWMAPLSCGSPAGGEPGEKVTSSVWTCSNLSASHCLIFLSFPAVKKR